MALLINYRYVLASAVASSLTVDQIRTKFRGGGTENMVKAMNEIVKELHGINDPMAIAVSNTAKALIAAPKAAQAPAQNGQAPWWQSGQAVQAPAQTATPDFGQMLVQAAQAPIQFAQVPAQVPVQAAQSARKVVDLDSTTSLDAPKAGKEVASKEVMEVVPKFETEKGLFRVIREVDDQGENFKLQSLSQGFWKTFISTRMFRVNIEKINAFNKAAAVFADKKTKTEFKLTVGGNLYTFIWMPDEKNPSIVIAKKGKDKNGNEKNVPGSHFISLKQRDYFLSAMADFTAIECCKKSVE